MPLVEALLFASEEPLSVGRLADLCGEERPTIEAALRALERLLDGEQHGIRLEAVAGGWRLVTAARYAEVLGRLKGPATQTLSPAALETLAVVLYRQPITRAELDMLRGVHSDSTLRTLVERGLLREVGRKDAPGRPITYGTTRRVLTQFGIRDIRDLPDPRELVGDDAPAQLFLRDRDSGV